jgi:hypothetical protein
MSVSFIDPDFSKYPNHPANEATTIIDTTTTTSTTETSPIDIANRDRSPMADIGSSTIVNNKKL